MTELSPAPTGQSAGPTFCLRSSAWWGSAALLVVTAVLTIATIIFFYRSTYKPTWQAFFLSPPGWMFLVACALTVGGMVLVWRRWRMPVPSWEAACSRAGLVAASIAGCVFLVAAEVGLRAAAEKHIWGEEIGGRLILPRGWGIVQERYQPMVERMAKEDWYFVRHEQLGWTVGASRQSADGLFRSGPSGFRTLVRGVEPNSTAPCRIALIGDSFTFGEEAPMEETWAFALQQRVTPRCRVLNYAVPSYGIGQMYLRLQQDVLPHKPDLVILGFTDGALDRTMGVYSFLMGLQWADSPWVGPRFGIQDGRLAVLNAPLPPVESLYTQDSIRALPAITYDRWYLTNEWEQPNWDWAYQSYLFRYLTTLYPIHSVVRPEATDEARAQVNAALFRAMDEAVRGNGSQFLVVYLPTMEDYGYRRRYHAPVTPAVLQQAGVSYQDETDCLKQLDEATRFLEKGIHYTPEGERRVGECLWPEVVRRLPFVAHPEGMGQ